MEMKNVTINKSDFKEYSDSELATLLGLNNEIETVESFKNRIKKNAALIKKAGYNSIEFKALLAVELEIKKEFIELYGAIELTNILLGKSRTDSYFKTKNHRGEFYGN